MSWFELSLENAFELSNGEEHLMNFVSKDESRLVIHLLTLVLKANHLVRLVKGLIFFPSMFKYFCELMIIIGLRTR